MLLLGGWGLPGVLTVAVSQLGPPDRCWDKYSRASSAGMKGSGVVGRGPWLLIPWDSGSPCELAPQGSPTKGGAGLCIYRPLPLVGEAAPGW